MEVDPQIPGDQTRGPESSKDLFFLSCIFFINVHTEKPLIYPSLRPWHIKLVNNANLSIYILNDIFKLTLLLFRLQSYNSQI